jgi:hypothetical protein
MMHPGQPFLNLPYPTLHPLYLSLGKRYPRSTFCSHSFLTLYNIIALLVAFRIFTPSSLHLYHIVEGTAKIDYFILESLG